MGKRPDDLRGLKGPAARKEIQDRIDAFQQVGLPLEVVEAIHGTRSGLLAVQTLKAKIVGLETRGFTDLARMIKLFPQILELSFENIDGKISGLNARCFTDPMELITDFPAILGYSFENIDTHLRLLGRVMKVYGYSQFSAAELMEKCLPLFGTKVEKILILVRVLQHFKVPLEEVEPRTIKRFLYYKLEDVLLVLDEGHQTFHDFKLAINERASNPRRVKMDRSQKRALIEKRLKGHMKIKRKYLKAYSKKLVG